MGRHTTKNRKKEAMRRVALVQVILRRWDPIGVLRRTDWPDDEYDGYAHHIVSMVQQGCTEHDLRHHLQKLRVTAIGVGPHPEGDAEIAAEIIATIRQEAV